MHALLLIIPLILGNIWHAIIPLVGRKKTKFKNSISENALRSRTVLVVHRVVHASASLSFSLYALYLASRGLEIAALLLFTAAVFDCAQVVTLNKKTVHTPYYFRDIHQIMAWLMAVLYLMFALVFSLQHIAMWLIVTYITAVAVMPIMSALTDHKYYWHIQMVFFILVSMMMVIPALYV